MYLLGNYQHTLDDKNRIRLPSNFRKEMGDEYVLMPGTNGCINVYKTEESERAISKLLTLESLNPEEELYLNKISAYSRNVSADGQGRFMLPDDLIKMYKIDKDVRIVGAFTKAQIWSEEAWQKNFVGENGLNSSVIDDIYRKLDAAIRAK